jgi:hypothetical protein
VFVELCHEHGHPPTEQHKARVGAAAKQLQRVNTPPEVIRGALEQLVIRNRPPNALTYLAHEVAQQLRANRWELDEPEPVEMAT